MAVVEGVRTSVDDLTQTEIDNIKALIRMQFDTSTKESENLYYLYISAEIWQTFAEEIMLESQYKYISDLALTSSGEFYMQHGIRWLKRSKITVIESKSVKNIRRGSQTPDKIFRVVNGQLKEIKKIYKAVNNQPAVVWNIDEKGKGKTIVKVYIVFLADTLTITFPALASEADLMFKINWGDNSEYIGACNQQLTHTYQSTGEYSITVLSTQYTDESGMLKGFYSFRSYLRNNSKILSVDIGETSNSDNSKAHFALIQSTFKNCTNLKYVKLPENYNGILNYMFDSCTYLQNVDNIETAVTVEGTFRNCTQLQSINLTSVKTISDYSFYNCSNFYSFKSTTAEKIGSYAFAKSGIKSVIINNVSTISSNAFADCKNLEDAECINVSTLSTLAFVRCFSLKTIKLSNKLKNIGAYAFSSSNLTIYFQGTSAEWNAVDKKANWDSGESVKVVYI